MTLEHRGPNMPELLQLLQRAGPDTISSFHSHSCISLSSIFLYHSPILSAILFLSVSQIFLSLQFRLPSPLSLPHHLSLSLYLSHALSIFLSLFHLFLPFSHSLCFSFSLSLSHTFLSLSLTICLYLSLPFSLYISLSLTLSPSQFNSIQNALLSRNILEYTWPKLCIIS